MNKYTFFIIIISAISKQMYYSFIHFHNPLSCILKAGDTRDEYPVHSRATQKHNHLHSYYHPDLSGLLEEAIEPRKKNDNK